MDTTFARHWPAFLHAYPTSLLAGPLLRKVRTGLLLTAHYEWLDQGTERFQIRACQRPHLEVVCNRMHIWHTQKCFLEQLYGVISRSKNWSPVPTHSLAQPSS